MIYSWTLSTFEPPQACAAFRAHNKCCKSLLASPQRRRWSQNKAQRIDQVGEFVGRNSAKWHWHSPRGRTYLVAKEIHGCMYGFIQFVFFTLYCFVIQFMMFLCFFCSPSKFKLVGLPWFANVCQVACIHVRNDAGLQWQAAQKPRLSCEVLATESLNH